jgi:hypothetical protein
VPFTTIFGASADQPPIAAIQVSIHTLAAPPRFDPRSCPKPPDIGRRLSYDTFLSRGSRRSCSMGDKSPKNKEKKKPKKDKAAKDAKK